MLSPLSDTTENRESTVTNSIYPLTSLMSDCSRLIGPRIWGATTSRSNGGTFSLDLVIFFYDRLPPLLVLIHHIFHLPPLLFILNVSTLIDIVCIEQGHWENNSFVVVVVFDH